MNQHREPRDALAAWVAGDLPEAERLALEADIAHDPDLAREAALIEALHRDRPRVPAQVLEGMRKRARAELQLPEGRSGRRWHLPRWQWSAAALVVLAAGTAVVWERRGADLSGIRASDPAAAVADPWLFDESVVAGEARLEDLSEEELNTLLLELER